MGHARISAGHSESGADGESAHAVADPDWRQSSDGGHAGYSVVNLRRVLVNGNEYRLKIDRRTGSALRSR
jgi:hypothetical protein